ncbi:programmed cell death protein 1 isoform X2 [Suricata suricatta]|uniref:programmed cell death protein 1 isoform X2 n=1 Tax=Suricata suricatta TaxID=37032 RepID=UPI0011556445|nr:programmed cell death protein 1 isoform X2 [Suricata suricatta]
MGTPRVPWPLVWAVLQLGWWPGWLLDPPDRPWSPLTFSPAQLTVLEGENASFVCSLPNVPASFVLNWYRMSPRNQTDKLAAFQENRTQPGKDRRFLVARLPSGQDFRMTILTTRLNDSGVYLCGAIYLPPNTQISESPRAELTVRGACGCQSEDEPLKEGPSEAPVFTVDYGELDFQWREKTPEPPAPCTPEQTEYATIVFPSRPGSPGPLPLRPEDGPCPWPL